NKIPDVRDYDIITAFTRGLRNEELVKKFTRKPPQFVRHMMEVVDAYASAKLTFQNYSCPSNREPRNKNNDSSKPSNKRKGDELVGATEHSQRSRDSRSNRNRPTKEE